MLSIIIPCLNESGHLARLLHQLAEQTDIHLEVIVVDGGSTDETVSIAADYDVRLIHSSPGRGTQQNAGARAAIGEYLLFLHADSRLDHTAQLAEALQTFKAAGTRTAGHFSMQFETSHPETRQRLAFFEYKTRLNRPDTFNGDQGLLIRRVEFHLLGGFSEKYGFLEDTDFAERFIAFGKFITLPGVLYTSARRFEEEGLEERLLLNTLIKAMFHLEGFDPDVGSFFHEAAGIYRQHNSQQIEGKKLNPSPFLDLANETMFMRGRAAGLLNWYRIGRYGTQNLWQVALWRGIKKGNPEDQLRRHDQFLKPVTDNPVGYLLGAVVIAVWFYSARRRLQSRQTNNMTERA